MGNIHTNIMFTFYTTLNSLFCLITGHFKRFMSSHGLSGWDTSEVAFFCWYWGTGITRVYSCTVVIGKYCNRTLLYGHLIVTDSFPCPWGKKALTFCLNSTPFIRTPCYLQTLSWLPQCLFWWSLTLPRIICFDICERKEKKVSNQYCKHGFMSRVITCFAWKYYGSTVSCKQCQSVRSNFSPSWNFDCYPVNVALLYSKIHWPDINHCWKSYYYSLIC